MRARFVGGYTWRKGYSGGLKDGRGSLQSGDIVEGVDAERLLRDYPRDFERVAEGGLDELKIGLDRAIRPGRHPRKTATKKRKRRARKTTQRAPETAAGDGTG